MNTHPAISRRIVSVVLLLAASLLWGCATPPSAAEIEARKRVRFEDSPDGVRAILAESILFEVGTANFANAAEPVIDVLKPAFAKARGRIIVEGHTDSTGSDALNRRLSIERAEKVRTAIVARQVPPTRVEARGMSKDKPRRSPEQNDDDRQQNRRAEIVFPGETVDSLGGREIEGKAQNVLAELSKALGQVKEGFRDSASQVKEGAKGVFEQLRDKIRGDGKK